MLLITIIFIIIIIFILLRWLLIRTLTKYIIFSEKLLNIYPTKFPKPGDIIIHNYAKDINDCNTKNLQNMRITCLNMERGKQMDKVIQQLQGLDPDIIILQEVDYFSQRTGRIDQAGEIAIRLNMNSVWVCEIELEHFDKTLNDDMNNKTFAGCEGNAILCKYPILDKKAIYLECQSVLKPGHRTFRKHIEAFTIIQTNSLPIGICSAHLEPHFTGFKGRSRQYIQLTEKLFNYMKYPLIIAGDFNTVCTGIGRLNIPKLSPDLNSILGSLGKSEALRFQSIVDNQNKVIISKFGEKSILQDPFDKTKDTTFTGMSGLYSAKLDWCLLSQHFNIINKIVGNMKSDICSDHMWITIDVSI